MLSLDKCLIRFPVGPGSKKRPPEKSKNQRKRTSTQIPGAGPFQDTRFRTALLIAGRWNSIKSVLLSRQAVSRGFGRQRPSD